MCRTVTLVAAAPLGSTIDDVIAAATQEAHRLGHARIGTEHLLLGLLVGDETVAGEALVAAGATLAAARHKVAEAVPSGDDHRTGAVEPPALTARAQRAIDRARRFARQQRADAVDTGHVLLGVLDVEGLASQVLRGLDVDIARLGAVLAPAVESHPAASLPTADDSAAPPDEHRAPTCPRCRAPLDGTLTETLVAARIDDHVSSEVSVVHCGACGETLGVLRPDWT
jgi:ATP-dependent Clp protease ATP-binding subunit ClpA